MPTEFQKKSAQAIVNIFETGRVHGEYGKVTLLDGDSGHLTYGRSQTTLASGNLFLLINAYCEADDAQLVKELKPYLNRLGKRDVRLDHNFTFRGLLEEAGDDPVMQEVQDDFFDRVYWKPSSQTASRHGLTASLATAVVYDSQIHGSWARILKRTNTRHGTAKNIGQRTWIQHYISERRDWLSTHSNTLLHRTVYRMDSFRDLIRQKKWSLALPFRIRGLRIDEDVLTRSVPIRVSAQDPGERILRRQRPFMRGPDVKAVQQALKTAGMVIKLDSVFGSKTEKAVKDFQKRRGLKVDGIVGPVTFHALGLES
ncbi:MAG: hypothetical protein NPIRA02_09820 [Nitrospirales bacterium]|nr:MAG: hypothetical protein NPIRA02_09820 [Nitrospirales bacterium]